MKNLLKAGNNSIEVAFETPLPYSRAERGAHTLRMVGLHEPTGRAWLRQGDVQFRLGLGHGGHSRGIWRDIELVAFDERGFRRARAARSFAPGRWAHVEVGAEVVRETPLCAAITVKLGRKDIAQPRSL